MKKSLMYLSAAMLAFGMVFMSACSDDEGGGSKEIPPALIKSITLNENNGGWVVTWSFTYDDQDRLTLTEVNEDGYEYDITYDYSVPGKLTELEDGQWETVFDVDSEGRITKQYRDDPSDYNTFSYNSEGYLVEFAEVRGGAVTYKETATVVDGNITVHTRYSDGVTASRTKVFTYLSAASAVNVSNLPQANLLNSERRTVSGLYGKGSRKLADYLELNYVDEPEAYVKNANTYTFDSENRVLTIARSGIDSEGNNTGLNEVFTYTYYEDEQ
ncbi:MAG TPA: hypothetical protein VFM90_06295 [Cyclobacteriaceae bacterium]|nr:hypothetical protein [Cyclobacteriaceae bacterium]